MRHPSFSSHRPARGWNPNRLKPRQNPNSLKPRCDMPEWINEWSEIAISDAGGRGNVNEKAQHADNPS